ncbi:hypothetical protein H632_c168p1 [Helicosporidium sp. ATCC 50920]|nr:hypothetical protein H632_c168p1 [Helicosporidium sp. ATCC 50920]|eukprot:KDD76594.1 hypothetical protein H632_c168p1 [Helicosporidium sp. ATCC 50920]
MAPKSASPSKAKATATKAAGVKKTKKDKDPNAPKRSLSAYFMYSNDVREQVKADNPGITFGEVGKKIGEQWAGLSAKEKEPYEKKAAEDKKRYEKEKEAYEGGSKKK